MARRKDRRKRAAASKAKEKEMSILESQQGSCSVLELIKERFNSDDNQMKEADEDFETPNDTFDFDKTWDQISTAIEEEAEDDDIAKSQSEIFASSREAQAELNFQVPEHEMIEWLKEDMEKLRFPPISRLKELVLEKLNKTEENLEEDSVEGGLDSEELESESKKPRLDSAINPGESRSSAKLDNKEVIQSSQDEDKTANETKVTVADDLPTIKIQLHRLHRTGSRTIGKAKQNSETIEEPTAPIVDHNDDSLEKTLVPNETEKTAKEDVVIPLEKQKVFSEGFEIETGSEVISDKDSKPSQIQKTVEETLSKTVIKRREEIPTCSKRLEISTVEQSNVTIAEETTKQIKLSTLGETTKETGSQVQGEKVTDTQTKPNVSTKILDKAVSPTSESVKDDIMTSIANELADMFGESMQEEELSVEESSTSTLPISQLENPERLNLEQMSPPSALKTERRGVQCGPFTILSTLPGAIFEESFPVNDPPTSASGETSKQGISLSSPRSGKNSSQQSRPVERSGPPNGEQRSTPKTTEKNTSHSTDGKRSNGFPSLSDPKKNDKSDPTFTPTQFPQTIKAHQRCGSPIVTLQCSTVSTSTNKTVSITEPTKLLIKKKLAAEAEVSISRERFMHSERTKHIVDTMMKPTSDKMTSNDYFPPNVFNSPIPQAVGNGLEMVYPNSFRSPRLKSPKSPKPRMGISAPPRLTPRPSSYLPDFLISSPTSNGGPITAYAAKPPPAVVAPVVTPVACPPKSVIVPPPLHQDTHNKFDAILECGICREQFLCYDDNLFKLHLLIKHDVKIEEEKYFSQSRKLAGSLWECKKCASYVLKCTEHLLHCRLSSIPFPIESSYELVNVTDKKLNKHECGICSKSFSARYKLKTHIEGSHKHLLSKAILYPQFRCAICLKGFETSVELTKHCRYCDQQFPTPETICELAKSYLHCDLCNKTHTHTRETTECYENKSVLRCVLCFDVFKMKDEFYKHLRAYHGLQLIKGPLTLRCPFCPGEGKVNWGKYTDIFPHIIEEHLQPRIEDATGAMNLMSFSNSLAAKSAEKSKQ